MYATVAELKTFKIYKSKYAKKFNANMSTVQSCIDELVAQALLNNNQLDPTSIVTYIEANPSCNLYRIFYILKPQTQEEKESIITDIITTIPLMVSSDNILYYVQTVEDEVVTEE